MRRAVTIAAVVLSSAGLVALGAGCGGGETAGVTPADATTIAKELDGIGPAKAQAIVDYRQKNGPFKTPEDLLKVEGIGDKVLDQNKGNIRVDRGGAPAATGARPAAKPAQKQGGG